MKTRTALTALLALAAVALPSLAHADTSTVDFLNPIETWVSANPGYMQSRHLSFTLASNQASGLVSYATGSLVYTPGKNEFIKGKLMIVPATITGTGSQLFSDRVYAWPSQGNGLNIATYPFNPFQADSLGVSISPANGDVTLTLKSWGNTPITFTTLADPGSGVIYGFAQKGSGPRVMETISIQEVTETIPS